MVLYSSQYALAITRERTGFLVFKNRCGMNDDKKRKRKDLWTRKLHQSCEQSAASWQRRATSAWKAEIASSVSLFLMPIKSVVKRSIIGY